jgi:hypothetical protein
VTGPHLRWPKERFYWSLLEAPHWKRAGPLPAGLLQALEEDIPVAAEELHAVGVPAGDGTLLVCAARAEELESLDVDLLTLCPEALPDFAPQGVEALSLNLLVGAKEPAPIRRAREGRHLARAAAVALVVGLLSIGLARRAAHLEGLAQRAQAASSAAVQRLLPSGTPDTLALEVNRARRVTESSARVHPAPSAAAALAALLRAWPTQAPSKPQSLVVTETGATVSLSVEGDPTPFLKAMKPPAGWSMDEPRLSASDKLTRLTLQLRPSNGGTP